MTLANFIKSNRTELTECVNRCLSNKPSVFQSLEELHQWVMNDEGLYNWARSEGVKI